jgi:DNA-binding transcriptional MerR regulator
MTNMLTIGRFSQVTRLTPKALRLYDDQGLLRPVYVDGRSGYRYYSLSHVSEAEQIGWLKATGMSLDGIQKFLRASDTEEQEALLEAHHQSLADQQAALHQALEALTVFRDQARRAYSVGQKTVEAQSYVGIRQTCHPEQVCAVIAQAQVDLRGLLRDRMAEATGPVVVLYHESDLEEHFDAWEVEVAQPYHSDYPLQVSAPFQLGTLSGGTMAFTIHAGTYNGYNGLKGAYATLWQWMGDNHWISAGPTRELYLFDPTNTPRPEDYRTEVAWPIKPKH